MPDEQPTTHNAPQPLPIPVDGPAVWDLVIADMQDRDRVGLENYGVRLTVGDGRDSLIDAYQESLDKSVYLKKAIIEQDGLRRRIVALEQRLEAEQGFRDKAEKSAILARAEVFTTNTQLTAAKERIGAAPHTPECESRLLVTTPIPWDEFKRAVCRSMAGCGHCEKCLWLQANREQERKSLPCNCWKSAAMQDGVTRGA